MERLKKFKLKFIISDKYNVSVFLFALIIAIYTGIISGRFFAVSVSEILIERFSASVGAISEKYPELTEDFTVSLLSPDYKYISQGENIIKKYGYSNQMNFEFLSEYPNLHLKFIFFTVIIIMACMLLISAFYIIKNNILKNYINNLSSCARNANNGKGYNPPEELCSLLVPLSSEIKCFCERNSGLLDKLRQEKENLKNFISDFSHQLKTPVSIISMNLQIINETENISEKDKQKLISIGLEQLERINWLIQGMLKIARLDCDSVDFENNQSDLNITCCLAANNFKLQAKSKNIIIENKTENKLSNKTEQVYFPHDGGWLYEAICNIIKNSIEHTPCGGKIVINTFSTPITVGIEIIDNGEGIPKESIPFIFNRFYNKTNGTNPCSVGIGLAISKSIVEKMGGRITCQSVKGRGTKMIICFLYNKNE